MQRLNEWLSTLLQVRSAICILCMQQAAPPVLLLLSMVTARPLLPAAITCPSFHIWLFCFCYLNCFPAGEGRRHLPQQGHPEHRGHG